MIDRRAVTALYQPIIELDTRQVVGFEALARGPAGSSLEAPDALFAAARAAGRLAELDWACRCAAFDGAMAAGLDPPATLFVNVEPETLDAPLPEDLRPVAARAATSLRVMVEFTERHLTRRPAALLRTARLARTLGWGVALDDVGADPRSIALLPFVLPDVVKLDLRLVQDRPDRQIAAVANAVNAYAERSGASILAEGIETDDHLEVALSLGATLGQGWYYARPAPLSPSHLPQTVTVPLTRQPIQDDEVETPFAIASSHRRVRAARRSLLLAHSHHLEDQAAELPELPILLAAFQTGGRFTPLTRARYEGLAQRLSLVAAIGVDIEQQPAAGVRGGALDPRDPLAEEWSVIVLGPHFAGALLARERGESSGGERLFDFVLTYDRDLIVRAARALMGRITPLPD